MSKRETAPARALPRARAAGAFILAAVVLVNLGNEFLRFLSVGAVQVPLRDSTLVGGDALAALLLGLGIGALLFGWGLLLRRRLGRSNRMTSPGKTPLGFDWYSRRGRKRDRSDR